ncbi:hypothetical protein [Bifidobacterium moukalabense]|uniref:hypothetical protein n=2 Tax=Bifidobacterium moukalabense TaxID=1333651 RepID=UPI0010F8D0AB|nr:hypothetical protein [Bifidobacterium moukalabense]
MTKNTIGRIRNSWRRYAGPRPKETGRPGGCRPSEAVRGAGAPVRETMDEIGDQTMEVVLKHYARTIPEHRRLVVNRMAEAMAHDGHEPAATLKTPDGTMTDPADSDATYKRIRECLEELASILEDAIKTNNQDGRRE